MPAAIAPWTGRWFTATHVLCGRGSYSVLRSAPSEVYVKTLLPDTGRATCMDVALAADPHYACYGEPPQ